MRNHTIILLVYNAVLALALSEGKPITLSMDEMAKDVKFAEVVNKIASDPLISQIIEPRGDYSLRNQIIHSNYLADMKEIVDNIYIGVQDNSLNNKEDTNNE